MATESLNLKRFKTKLQKDIVPYVEGAGGDENQIITRALVGLFLASEAGMNLEESDVYIVDEGDDMGIDGIYFDARKDILHIAQAKFRINQTKSLDQADMLKFKNGVEKVIQGDLSGAGSKLRKAYRRVQHALEDINTRIHLTTLSTGSATIAPNVQKIMDDFCKRQNAVDEVFYFNYLGFEPLFRHAKFFSPDISTDVVVKIGECGAIQSPYQSYFGYVAGGDIATWVKKHGTSIFSQNVRFTITDSEVNDEIFDTISNDPLKFWYFNNGITAIAKEARKAPAAGEMSTVNCSSLSIVNGAQTAGMLARAAEDGVDLTNVLVPFRVISLVGAEPGFDEEITKANNTQNELRPLDFVSLDPKQEMLQNELSALGYQYVYKRGAEREEGKEQIEVKDVAVALACAHSDISISVQAKRYISGLWKNIKERPYTDLFPEHLTGDDVIFCVKVMKLVEDVLRKKKQSAPKDESLIITHGDKFVAHCVFRHLHDASITSIDDNEKIIAGAVEDLANKTLSEYKKKFEGYPATVFKNQQSQETLRNSVLEVKKTAS